MRVEFIVMIGVVLGIIFLIVEGFVNFIVVFFLSKLFNSFRCKYIWSLINFFVLFYILEKFVYFMMCGLNFGIFIKFEFFKGLDFFFIIIILICIVEEGINFVGII